MLQNLISIILTDDQVAAIDHAIGELENQLQGFVSLSIDARAHRGQDGPKSEAFCRQTTNALQFYPQVVPPSIGEEARSDLEMLDQLRPRCQRLHRLSQRSSDSELALGSDVMVAAPQGYRVLKVFGKLCWSVLSRGRRCSGLRCRFGLPLLRQRHLELDLRQLLRRADSRLTKNSRPLSGSSRPERDARERPLQSRSFFFARFAICRG